MKNKDKYDNRDDALEAFTNMCYSRSCSACSYFSDADTRHKRCEITWLYDEAEELEKWQKNILDKFSNKE